MDISQIKLEIKTAEDIVQYGAADEAQNLLQNGILVETNTGLICMSLNDALSSNLNLSVEDLQNVATQLISQQKDVPPINNRVHLQSCNLNFDSDGFSSECSDVGTTSATVGHNTIFTLSSLANEIKTSSIKSEGRLKTKGNNSKIISFVPVTLDMKNFQHEEISLLPMNSSSDISANSNVSDSDTSIATSFSNPPTISVNKLKVPTDESKIVGEVTKPPKRRGGWPKGRKRKPELLNLPPKAPATGYNLYLNEQRKLFKESALAFHEITKIIGNKWSSLSLDEKKPYLEKAEEDKKRYREELNKYRQSDAYRAYLNKKRKNRLQNNILSESDMDATDEIDDEDNEELYCRTCDQWFHNLHNKREHLQGRQHTQSVAGDIRRELESAETNSNLTKSGKTAENNELQLVNAKMNNETGSVCESINQLITIVAKRESEIKSLECRLQEARLTQTALWQQLCSLTEREIKLKNDLLHLKEHEKLIESSVFQLWKVPSLFVVTDFNTDINEFSEEN